MAFKNFIIINLSSFFSFQWLSLFQVLEWVTGICRTMQISHTHLACRGFYEFYLINMMLNLSFWHCIFNIFNVCILLNLQWFFGTYLIRTILQWNVVITFIWNSWYCFSICRDSFQLRILILLLRRFFMYYLIFHHKFRNN